MNTLQSTVQSWHTPDSMENSIEESLSWIRDQNETIAVEIHKNQLEDSGFGFCDREEDCICNRNRSFFTFTGYRQAMADGTILSQPIIVHK